MIDLQAIFGNGTVPTTAATQSVALPKPIPRPQATEMPTPAVETEWAAVVETPDFDNLPVPGEPCARCGSLEKWWDILRGEHCQRCERATLERSIQWADRATRLRKLARPRKPAPRIAPCCGSGGIVDTQDLGHNLPLQRQPEGFVGV